MTVTAKKKSHMHISSPVGKLQVSWKIKCGCGYSRACKISTRASGHWKTWHCEKKEGKKDRLIGDSKVSGASPSANFADRAGVPSLLHFEAALDRFASFSGHGAPLSTEWVMLALDIQGAHKSIRTAPADVGLAVSVPFA